jgi:hypothetical protein
MARLDFTRIIVFLAALVSSCLSYSAASAKTYYVDPAGGSDANVGTSTTAPFYHSPGDPAATSTALSSTLLAGDSVVFKRGTVYKTTIKCTTAGTLLFSGGTGAITTGGVLTDSAATFTTKGIASGDYVYIYHSKQSTQNTWVESVGVFRIASIDSQTQLTLTGFDGSAHQTAEMTYRITRPVTYKSIDGWGTGDAVIDGENVRQILLDLNGKSMVRVESLTFLNAADDAGAGGAGAIKGSASGTQIDNCTFTNMGANAMYVAGDYSVISRCNITNHGYLAFNAGAYNTSVLFENNNVFGPGCRSVFGGRFLIVRNSLFKDLVRPYGGAHSDSIGFIDGGPNMNNHFGWIYGNTIDNFVEAIALYDNWPNTAGGTRNWVIHSNLIIGRLWEKGTGDGGIVCKQCQNNIIANNTIVSSSSTGIGMNVPINLDIDSNNNIISNNIVSNPGNDSVMVFLRLGDPSNLAWNSDNNVFDRNHYFSNASTGPFRIPTLAGKNSYATWKGMGYDSNSAPTVTTQPVFVSPSSLDFRLYDTSKYDLATGLNLSSYFTADKDFIARSSIGNYNLGAFNQILIVPGVLFPQAPATIAVN